MPFVTKLDPYQGGRIDLPWDDELHSISSGVTVTASVTPHTKGVWVEMLSAANNTFDIGMLWFAADDNHG